MTSFSRSVSGGFTGASRFMVQVVPESKRPVKGLNLEAASLHTGKLEDFEAEGIVGAVRAERVLAGIEAVDNADLEEVAANLRDFDIERHGASLSLLLKRDFAVTVFHFEAEELEPGCVETVSVDNEHRTGEGRAGCGLVAGNGVDG